MGVPPPAAHLAGDLVERVVLRRQAFPVRQPFPAGPLRPHGGRMDGMGSNPAPRSPRLAAPSRPPPQPLAGAGPVRSPSPPPAPRMRRRPPPVWGREGR